MDRQGRLDVGFYRCNACGASLRLSRAAATAPRCPGCGGILEPGQSPGNDGHDPGDIGQDEITGEVIEDGLGELTMALGTNRPGTARATGRRREARLKAQQKSKTTLAIVSVAIIAVICIGAHWFYMHPYMQVVDQRGRVLYEGRPHRDEAPAIRQRVLGEAGDHEDDEPSHRP